MKICIIAIILFSRFVITSSHPFVEGFVSGYITRNIFRSVKKVTTINRSMKTPSPWYVLQCKRVPDFPPDPHSYCSADEIIVYIQPKANLIFILSLRNLLALLLIYLVPLYVIWTVLWGSLNENTFLCGLLSGILLECILNKNHNKNYNKHGIFSKI